MSGTKRVIWVVVVSFVCAVSASDDDAIQKKMEALERRLASLEEKVKQNSQETREGDSEDLTVEVEEIRRQVDILAGEVEKIRSGEPEHDITRQRANSLGVGPSAADVYRKPHGVSVAGYGEMLYENFDSQDQSGLEVDKPARLDMLRAILYAGYRFNDRFLVNTEIEFEHGSTDKSGNASVEFAYVEYLHSDQFSLRGGLLLLPMGLTNEFHEPNVFLGTTRPQTERYIIPTTWREGGFGGLASVGNFNFRVYAVNGLNAAGFSAAGIRGGRQKGSKALAEDMAIVGRVDYSPTPGVFFGGSLYQGGSGQGQYSLGDNSLKVPTTIFEVHGQTQFRGWDLRGLYAANHIGDALELNLARGLPRDSAIAERMKGGYLQAGYNVLSRRHDTMTLTPYFRYEVVDTQNKMPFGFTANPVYDRTFYTLGLEYKPIYNIVVKGDYQWQRNDLKSGVNQFNIALGYSF